MNDFTYLVEMIYVYYYMAPFVTTIFFLVSSNKIKNFWHVTILDKFGMKFIIDSE